MRPPLPICVEKLCAGGHHAYHYWVAQLDLGDLWWRAELEAAVERMQHLHASLIAL